MPDATSWNVVSTGKSNRVILGVDFPAAGRAEGSFTELAARLGSEFGFLQTAAPPFSPDQRISGDAYTQRWIDDARQSGWQVAAVLGYCLGSVYTAPIAESISGWQDFPPKTILFDPLQADIRLLGLETRKVIARFGPLLSKDEVELAEKRIAEIVTPEPGVPADLADVAVALVGLYRDIGIPAFDRLGLNDSRKGEMTRLFESYMSWMSVAAQIDPMRSWRQSTAIMSAEYVRQSDGEASANVWDSIFGEKIALDIAHADLLRSESTVQVILGQVAAP
jgi:hypothetical protein